ncbi:MAG: hypothetical protein ACRCYP_02320, partial [Alphaproteobacteria bacterium]
MRSVILWMLWMIFIAFSLPDSTPEWLTGMLAGGAIVGTIIGWFYKKEIKKVEELRERLKESEPNSIYRNLENKQLKNKTLTHVKAIRSFIKQKELDQTHLNVMVMAHENDEKGHPMSLHQKNYRDKGFHLESMSLRNELWARLPLYCRSGELCQREGSCNMIYEQPLNLTFMAVIANDLE